MQAITSDLSSILQLNQFAFQVDSPKITPVSGDINQNLLNDIAAVTSPMSNSSGGFDMMMNDLASYKDVISAAQDGLSQIRTKAVDIKDIISQAQQGNLSQELLDEMQAEVDAKILDISILKDAANEDGTGTFGEYNFNIPDTQALMGMASGENPSNVTAYNFDINFDIDGVSFAGSANIAIGKGDNGAFTFAFDVNLDYDLSGLTTEGITSESAPNIIDNFLSTLDEQAGTLVNANKLIDSVFEKIFDNMNATSNSADGISGFNSSSFLRQQIVQQSSMTLDSIMMNQMPNLALSLL